MLNKIKRITKVLLQRKHPGFLFTLRYFQPKPKPIIAMHRRLFLLSCKSPLGCCLSLIGGLRWITYYAWKKSYWCYRLKIRKLFLTSPRHIVAFNMLRLSVCHLVPPRCYLKYRLYEAKQTKDAFNYFYQIQLPYFHDYSNRHVNGYHESRRLLADKYQFELALQKIGIPTIKSEFFLTNHYQDNAPLLLQKRRFFCKPNQASASEDAFLLDYDPTLSQYTIDNLNEGILTNPIQIDTYLRQVCRRHPALLIQPVIEDIPELKQWSARNVLTTIRIITGKYTTTSAELPSLLYVQMELPLDVKEATEHHFSEPFAYVPLHVISLDVDPVFKQKKCNPYYDNIYLSEQLKHAIRQGIIYCQKTHQQLLQLRSAAFEIVLELSGPMILEANYNWNIEWLYHVLEENSVPDGNPHPAALWLKTLVDETP